MGQELGITAKDWRVMWVYQASQENVKNWCWGLWTGERLGSQHGKGMSITVDHCTVVLIKGLWWVWTEGERLEEALVM